MAIELRLLRHALAVGQHGNFARAAEALHLTQPSLSRSIAALEDLLGVPLFDRTPKGVTPTVFGRVLLERGDIVMRREADLRREIALLAGLEMGSLVVSAAPYMNETLIARAIGRIAATHPKLRIDCRSLHPGEVVRQVLAEEADVGVANMYGLSREARIAVVSLPMCNMYLQDRHRGRTPRWRGVTLLHEMRARGIPVAVASDNTRDPFYAYGDLDVAEVYREAVRILQLDHPIDAAPHVVTTTPADVLRRPEIGRIAVGMKADLVLFRARGWSELLSLPKTRALTELNAVSLPP